MGIIPKYQPAYKLAEVQQASQLSLVGLLSNAQHFKDLHANGDLLRLGLL